MANKDDTVAYADRGTARTTLADVAVKLAKGRAADTPPPEKPLAGEVTKTVSFRDDVPVLKPRDLPTREETRYHLGVIHEHGGAMREILDAMFNALDGSREEVEKALAWADEIAAYVDGWEKKGLRAGHEARRNVMRFALTLLSDVEESRAKRAMAHFVRLGLRIRFFVFAENRTPESRKFKLDLYDMEAGQFVQKNFSVTDPHDTSFISEVADAIRAIDEGRHQARDREREEFLRDTVMFDVALDAGEGITTISIPAGGRTGRDPLPGGIAKVRIKNGKIWPVDGTRGIKNTVLRLAEEKKVWIPTEMLFEDRLRMPHRIHDDVVWHDHRIFHGMLRRGMRVREERQARRDQKVEMRSAADLSPREWFIDERPGKVFCILRNPWKWNGKSLPAASFVFVRDDEGKVFVEACDDPAWAFLAEQFKEPAASGRNFEGLSEPLGPMLRHFLTIFGSKRHR